MPKNGLKVFSCFHCGGGSTMGYKLAGYDVLGGVEIDKDMMAVYRANHHPRHSYLMGVQKFKVLEHLPPELFDLDILDGSPPCSSFSMSGAREKHWSTSRKFAEGQKDQVLDDLFFHFIDIAKRLQPKVVIAENVRGLVIGNARGYVKEIFRGFREAGYGCQLFLLNASLMGVPQRRERTFFLARRQDLVLPEIKLSFTERPISCAEAFRGLPPGGKMATEDQRKWWLLTKPGDAFSKVHPKGHAFNAIKLHPNRPASTLAAQGGRGSLYHWLEPRRLTDAECVRIQTFPDDFNFGKEHGYYVCGMSVPPFMMQRLALEVGRQWFFGGRR